MNKKLTSIIFSILFTAVLLYILFQYISIEAIWMNISQIHVKYIVIAFFFHLGAYFARACILHFFLRSYKINYFWLLSAHFVQNLFVHLIPASLGEISFSFLVRNKIPYENSLSSLIVTKLAITVGTIIGFIIAGIFIFKEKIFYVFQYPGKLIFVSIALCMFLVLVWLTSKAITKYKDKIKNKLLKKAVYFIVRTFSSIHADLKKLKSAPSLIIVISLTIISIAFISMFYMYILKGLKIDLSILEIIFISSIGMAFMILPIKSIGGFGTTEGSWAIGMVLIGFSEKIGVLTGFIIHIYALLNVIIIFLLGVLIKWLIFRY